MKKHTKLPVTAACMVEPREHSSASSCTRFAHYHDRGENQESRLHSFNNPENTIAGIYDSQL